MPATRDRLLSATNELFRRQGFHGTGLKEVIAAAEATTGSLYHFFPGGKSQLAEAVIVESGKAYRDLFELIADQSVDIASAVAEFFDGAALVLESTDYIDICPIGTVAREVASLDEALRLACDGAFTSWIDALAGRLSAAGVSAVETTALATTVVAALEGGFILARSRRDPDVLRSVGAQMSSLVRARLAAVPPGRRSRPR